MLNKNFKISSFIPPGLATCDGELFIVPGWHKIPKGTTLKEVNERWTQKIVKSNQIIPTEKISEMVLSSKGDNFYNVTFDGRWWDCSCPGFGFRRTCRHIDEVKLKYKNNEKIRKVS